jgi:clan AA aspartic protease
MMITGVVRSLEASVKLPVQGPNGRARQIEAVVDSGFTGCLTLPRHIIDKLGLDLHGFQPGVLADGSERLFEVYGAEVMWDRRMLEVAVHEAEASPLIGMALLRGYELRM